MRTFFLLGLLGLSVPAAIAATSAPATTPATRPAALDLAFWRGRAVELLLADVDRWAKAKPGQPDEQQGMMTPLTIFPSFDVSILDDDAASARVAGAIDVARAARKGAPDAGVDYAAKLYRLPRGQRWLRLAIRRSPDDFDRPIVEPGNEVNLGSSLRLIPERDYASTVTPILDEMDRKARASGKTGGLGIAYLELAQHAQQVGRRVRANGYADRLLALWRERPIFNDPRRGNVDAPAAENVARLLRQLGRAKEYADLIATTAKPNAKASLAIGGIADALATDDPAAAQRIIDQTLRPLDGTLAIAADAVLRGQAKPRAKVPPRRQIAETPIDPLRAVRQAMAEHLARQGDIEKAAAMLPPLSAGLDDGQPAKSFEVARLAMLAGVAGKTDEARAAFERVLKAHAADNGRIDSPAEIQRRADAMHAFVAVGAWRDAAGLFTSSAPVDGATHVRLAALHRQLGEAEAAKAELREAIRIVDADESKPGESMMAIAVELQAQGDPAQAERMLLGSLSKIHGEDFGFGGTGEAIETARRMNRPDLIERLYQQGDAGERMMIALTCARIAWYEANEPAAGSGADGDVAE